MAKCARCGKKSIFLKVNDRGLCLDCERQTAQEYINDLISRLSPEQQNIVALQTETQNLNRQISQMQGTIQQQISIQQQKHA